MDQPKASIIITADGSHSLYIKELDEHYHSIHGAIQESKHVFIEAGLKYLSSRSSLHILEVGFGTGLNAFLTAIEPSTAKLPIHYTSIEPYPLEPATFELLNYPELIAPDKKELFKLIHESKWEEDIPLLEHFVLHKRKAKLAELEFSKKFDLIYFDAFAPRVQPELWTEEIFSKLFLCMSTNACLLTYCAKGEVKRTMKKAGFVVEALPGPPRKREMVRAIKTF